MPIPLAVAWATYLRLQQDNHFRNETAMYDVIRSIVEAMVEEEYPQQEWEFGRSRPDPPRGTQMPSRKTLYDSLAAALEVGPLQPNSPIAQFAEGTDSSEGSANSSQDNMDVEPFVLPEGLGAGAATDAASNTSSSTESDLTFATDSQLARRRFQGEPDLAVYGRPHLPTIPLNVNPVSGRVPFVIEVKKENVKAPWGGADGWGPGLAASTVLNEAGQHLYYGYYVMAANSSLESVVVRWSPKDVIITVFVKVEPEGTAWNSIKVAEILHHNIEDPEDRQILHARLLALVAQQMPGGSRSPLAALGLELADLHLHSILSTSL